MATEERFGVGFEDTAFQSCLTIGDFHAVLMRKLGNVEGIGGQCASQMAFYRLRRAAGPGNNRADPKTRLDQLGLGSPRKTMKALNIGGLPAPKAGLGWFGMIAAVIAIFASMAMVLTGLAGESVAMRWMAAIVAGAGMTVLFAPRRYPQDIETLGDLANAVARRNPMMLKAQGAGLRQGAVWESLRDLAAEHSGASVDEIFLDTPLYQQKAKSEAA
ncbi:MAG: hypothetical protein J7498_08780 [Sphingobium sp.]|nr:hypothetical protein [Sphingobium sp.]